MKHIDVSMDGLSVMIGIPAGRDFHPLTVLSLLETVQACRNRNITCDIGMSIGSSVVQWARDEVADQFLKGETNRLFWIDSDMYWRPGDFIRLLAFSQFCDVVLASYPAKDDTPTFYVNHDTDVGLKPNDMGLVEIDGAGLGFACISRGVMTALAKTAPDIKDDVSGDTMKSLFRVDAVTNKHGDRSRRGEDMAFFSDIKALGFKVFLDPSISLGHIGQKIYTGSILDAMT